ncbi:hypothetical protein ANOM_005686 [Aspergillus nomiae NRRL 13137]|uniref:DUF7702 domain-containing protein n=1 Tax=Aspergillus nomiae NRRL (strain ATCC 15546 / NRRL 13137 / CBS 260.88 / M93) TaxID=1509407 RepID=A0A0L1J5P8_ASPN3|nr:uncharacterized protein ANOM_005686 [Aspergillus nomiae NRRL 13137]KNG87064.1 hypothetical protein ANOM_005686 [Aspergillus nomiae NRRL 13137]
MGKLDERDGIAILQLIIFPFILAAAIFIWNRAGWRVGRKIWRYPVTLSLLRIAGSISTMIAIDHRSTGVTRAENVCELIGLAPLLLTYIGILRQIDTEKRIPRRPLTLVTVLAFVGLILGIAGVSTANVTYTKVDGHWTYTYHPGALVKASMGIFIAVFVITILMTGWLFFQLCFTLRRFQTKLFLATAFSTPFLVVRLVYSALGDYDSDDERFSLIKGNATIYLCMAVLEEIAAMAITMALSMSAVLEKDFVKLRRPEQEPEVGTEPKYNSV